MSTEVALGYPFRGRWLALNSPADRVPSHGTTLFATSYAIDFVPVDEDGRSGRYGVRSLFVPEAPERFVGFGRSVLAPADGVVAAVHDGEPDHPAYRGLPSLGYMATQARRARQGWAGLAGNHVVLELEPACYVALCHLRRSTIAVRAGERVARGQVLGECGNSGNSTEPHVHVQAMSSADPSTGVGRPISFGGALPRNGETIDGGAAGTFVPDTPSA